MFESVCRGRVGEPRPARFSVAAPRGGKSLGDSSPEFFQEATRAVVGLFELLREKAEQKGLRESRLAELHREVRRLKAENTNLRRVYGDQIGHLERQLVAVRAESRELKRRLAQGGESYRCATPPDFFLDKPLVVRTSRGEFLGVRNQAKHFTLRDFVAVIQAGLSPSRALSLSWEKRGLNWCLRGRAHGGEGGVRDFVLVVQGTTTPSNNAVIRIVLFNIDGGEVPKGMILGLLKRIKERSAHAWG